MNKKGLGKGLGAIFTDNETIAPVEEVQPHEKEIEIAVNDIIPNPLQPRKTFAVATKKAIKKVISLNCFFLPSAFCGFSIVLPSFLPIMPIYITIVP